MTVDADLTPVKIDNLLPGWVKAAGKPARATYTLVKTDQSLRFDDLTIAGSGTNVKGSVELDAASDIVSANFPVFSLSDGDKVSLKADRGSDGVLRVAMRGDVFDGSNFVKTSLAGAAPDKAKQKQTDLDLDIKLGTVVGHNGETLRGLDLKVVAPGRPHPQFRDERQDRPRHAAQRRPARAQPRQSPSDLFRDRRRRRIVPVHRHVSAHVRRADVGGDGPADAGTSAASRHPLYPQFRRARRTRARSRGCRARPARATAACNSPRCIANSRGCPEAWRCATASCADRWWARPSKARSTTSKTTCTCAEHSCRSTVSTTCSGRFRSSGLFLGAGSNEGLLGITYEAVGPPGAPRITVNPVTAIAPGLLRKFIPSPGNMDRNFIPPSR